MKVAQWAEIRRLFHVEGLSRAQIARQVRCCHKTVAAALAREQPPRERGARTPRRSRLDPYKPRIDALVAQHPELTAVRIREEIRRGPDGYRGGLTVLREYLTRTRPRRRRRVYQEVHYEPGQALQVD